MRNNADNLFVGGKFLETQSGDEAIDTRGLRRYRLVHNPAIDDLGESVRESWDINAYWSGKDYANLAHYKDGAQAKQVWRDFLAVLRNGEIADFPFPLDRTE